MAEACLSKQVAKTMEMSVIHTYWLPKNVRQIWTSPPLPGRAAVTALPISLDTVTTVTPYIKATAISLREISLRLQYDAARVLPSRLSWCASTASIWGCV